MSVLNQDKASNLSPNPARYSVKVADISELSQLVDILMSSFYPQVGWNRWLMPLIRLGLKEDLKMRLTTKSHRYACLAAVFHAPDSNNEGTLVGTVELSLRSQFWHPFHPRRPYIANLAVQSQHRRQQVAQRLLTACEDIAYEWGVSTLYLHVKTHNFQAMQLYQKMGYERCPEPSWWLHSNRLLLVKQL